MSSKNLSTSVQTTNFLNFSKTPLLSLLQYWIEKTLFNNSLLRECCPWKVYSARLQALLKQPHHRHSSFLLKTSRVYCLNRNVLTKPALFRANTPSKENYNMVVPASLLYVEFLLICFLVLNLRDVVEVLNMNMPWSTMRHLVVTSMHSHYVSILCKCGAINVMMRCSWTTAGSYMNVWNGCVKRWEHPNFQVRLCFVYFFMLEQVRVGTISRPRVDYWPAMYMCSDAPTRTTHLEV